MGKGRFNSLQQRDHFACSHCKDEVKSLTRNGILDHNRKVHKNWGLSHHCSPCLNVFQSYDMLKDHKCNAKDEGSTSSSPLSGQWTCNTAGIMDEEGNGCIGCLIRNFEGKLVIGFCGKVASNTIIRTELLAISSILRVMQDKGWNGVSVQSACGQAISLINALAQDWYYHDDRVLIIDIRNQLANVGSTIRQVPHERNRAAGILAEMGGSQDEQFVRILVPSKELRMQLYEDTQVKHDEEEEDQGELDEDND